METNVRERAEELGLVIYDTALPQEWFDEVLKATAFGASFGFNPCGHIVWGYDHSLYGEPVALTIEGEAIIGAMEIQGNLNQPNLVCIWDVHVE